MTSPLDVTWGLFKKQGACAANVSRNWLVKEGGRLAFFIKICYLVRPFLLYFIYGDHRGAIGGLTTVYSNEKLLFTGYRI